MSHTVLICDDAIFMRTMVGDILQQAGFEIVGEAETGLQAVEKYKQLRPDLVTMDIVMPDMGGIDAVREITRFDPQAKILMCSAMGQQALVVEAIQAGAIARSNAHEDIERGGIAKSAAAAGSGAVQAIDAAVGAVQEQGDLEKALGSVVSKLDVFVQIMDKTSQVSVRKPRS